MPSQSTENRFTPVIDGINRFYRLCARALDTTMSNMQYAVGIHAIGVQSGVVFNGSNISQSVTLICKKGFLEDE